MLTGEFVIRKNGKLEKYNRYDEIPSCFEHLISFKPVYPPEPHTKEQHDQMSKYNDYLKELMSRASGN